MFRFSVIKFLIGFRKSGTRRFLILELEYINIAYYIMFNNTCVTTLEIIPKGSKILKIDFD